ncbi:hypothetical protein [Mycobacterium sp.]|uniref:hypothetical protein n=1 Tax=Mycobacterium sp. TaxID=1785 RepID=UPI002D419AF7|nr:hypothetical protein [Mycobacterium sp.]HZA12221.1 hypothetical protein [Mycobacterium sp.]
MRTHLRVIAAVVICLGVATGCQRTTGGTVAMTTEPGPPISARPSTTTSRPTALPPTRRPSPTSEVPPPPNATAMTCKNFSGLDDATRRAVVKAILDEQKDSPFGMLGPDFAQSMATTMCQFMPDSTVKEVLTGAPPR